MTTKPRVAWDSSILIDAIQKTEPYWTEIKPVYRAAVQGRLSILVSEISVAEVCRITDPAAGSAARDEAIRRIGLFFQSMFVERRPVDRRESSLAAQIIRDLNLETCDAIIAATASVHGAIALYTRDGLKARGKKKTGLLKCDGQIGDPALPIIPPSASHFATSPLFRAIHEPL